MTFLRNLAVLILFPVLLLAGGCMSDLTGTNYDRVEVRTLQSVQFGEVVDVENVKLEGSKSGVGTVAGAAVGGIAGSNIGHGRGSAVAAIAGAVAGGVLGSVTENKITESTGLNITVRLDNGNHVSVIQQLEKGNSFRVGDRVKVLTQGRTARVVHSAR